MPATEQTAHNQKRLHLIFAISGLVLLGATIWMFAADSDREWKDTQRTFRQMEVKMSGWAEEQAKASIDEEEVQAKEQAVLVARSKKVPADVVKQFQEAMKEDALIRAELAGRSPDAIEIDGSQIAEAYDEYLEEIAAADKAFESSDKEESDKQTQLERRADARTELLADMADVIARASFREEKFADDRKTRSGELDAAKSRLDLAVRDDLPTEEAEKGVQRVIEGAPGYPGLELLTKQTQQAEAHRKELQRILDEITAEQREAEEARDDIDEDVEAIHASLEKRKATWFTDSYPGLGKKWLELPILDAFGSPLKIENLWSEGLTHDMYNFKPVMRYDRCTTCHQAMEKTQPGSATQPLFRPAHELTFVLALPQSSGSEAEGDDADESKAADDQANTVRQQFGMHLADEGLLDRNAVTIAVVMPNSPASEASLVEDSESRNYISREELQRSLSAGLPADGRSPLFGLQTADAILEINGSKVLSNDDVRRMLIDSAVGDSVTLKVRRGFPHPYVTHPRLDLFVGSTSPHKLQGMGCTVCHDGQGSATSFKWASHSPNTLKDREEWKEEYGWFDNHHWIFPMHPTRFVESSCLKCHHDVVELEPSEKFPEPPAPKVVAGYNNVRRYGCFGCHEVNGYDGPDKRVGPDLRLEPNYFAAGLQLSHLANQRLEEISPSDDDAAVDNPAAESLLEVIELGEELANAPERDDIRHRLQQIINLDKQAWDDHQAAVAAGEESAKDAQSALPPEAYQVASVLKDEETPGKFRKVGPSLRYVATKLDANFLDDWVRKPSDFRPSTRMPQFFGLYDHLVGLSSDPKEQAKETAEIREQTRALEEVEIAGIRSYLLEYSQPFEPAEAEDLGEALASGDVDRGKVMFEIGGCLACHSNDDFPGHGDQGPDLSRLGEKFKGEAGKQWLYGWIENPKRYHARTKMPVVPLKPLQGDEETDPIADVVAYLLSGDNQWQAKPSTPDEEVLDLLTLKHLEKTFYEADAAKFLRDGIPESRRAGLKGAEVELLLAEELITQGDQLSNDKKLLYVGRKAIGKYGCYACHDIPGFEGAKPIGTALSDWGRKDPSKLAFEHIDHYAGHHGHGHGHGHGGGHGEESHEGDGHAHDDGTHSEKAHGDKPADEKSLPAYQPTTEDEDQAYYAHQLHHHSRIGFIHQKLKEPRSYDYKKVTSGDAERRLNVYNDRLRMPQFPLSHDQHEEVITFVLGLVAAPPAEKFVFSPSPRQQAINEGRKVLDRFNCAGCHELQSEEWALTLPADHESVAGFQGFRPPPEPETFPFLLPQPTPTEIAQSQETDESSRLHAKLTGRPVVDSSGELEASAYDAIDEIFLPLGEFERDTFTRNNLAYKFSLWEPSLIDGNVYMPKDGLPEIPTELIKDRHAAHGGDLTWYLLPRVLKITGQKKGSEAWGWLPPSLVDEGKKVQPDWLHSFLLDPHPIRPAVVMNMPKFNMSSEDATKLVNYFAARDGAEYPYVYQNRTRPSHLESLEQRYRQAVAQLPAEQQERFSGDRFDDVMKIVTSPAGCVKCHSLGNYVSAGDRLAKGPNLTDAHRRLQPDYMRRWIAKPSYILPYTAMPDLIKYSPNSPETDGFYDSLPDKSLVKVYHGDSTEQLDALVDLLMNFDKFAQSQADIAAMVPTVGTEEDAAGTTEPDTATDAAAVDSPADDAGANNPTTDPSAETSDDNAAAATEEDAPPVTADEPPAGDVPDTGESEESDPAEPASETATEGQPNEN